MEVQIGVLYVNGKLVEKLSLPSKVMHNLKQKKILNK